MAWLDVATEARAMRAAAAADLAPAVIAVDAEAGLLLTDYRTTLWAPDLVRQPTVVAMIVRLLRALHRLRRGAARVFRSGLRVDVISRRWPAAASRALTRGRGALGSRAHATRRVDFDTSYAPTAFCHNDLGAANILIDGAAARLIDFEYAGRGAPLLDLASLAGMNDFDGSAATAAARRVLRNGAGADRCAISTMRFAW